MGSAESKFINEINEHSIKHEHDVCSCGQKLYKYCNLGYKPKKNVWDDKEVKCKVLKKQHCEICHVYCDPNLARFGGYFDDGISKLSQMSLNHCCKCKRVIEDSSKHCGECCTTFKHGKTHCCNCNVLYNPYEETHCCKCNIVYKQKRDHCCNCNRVYDCDDYHCCKCRMEWKVSHSCTKTVDYPVVEGSVV